MIKSIYGIFLAAIACGCATSDFVHSTNTEEVIYKSDKTPLIIVFNFKIGRFALLNDKYLLNRNLEYGEFSGPLEDCSDSKFRCVRGGVSVSVPRNTMPESWANDGRICSLISSKSEIYYITCSQKIGGEIHFSYEQKRGIISYKHDDDQIRDNNYVLSGKVGILSQ